MVEHGRQPRYDRDGAPLALHTIAQRCELLVRRFCFSSCCCYCLVTAMSSSMAPRQVDAGTFRPLGRMAGKAEYDDSGQLARFTPANFVLAHGKINGRPVVVGEHRKTWSYRASIGGNLCRCAIRTSLNLALRCTQEAKILPSLAVHPTPRV
eukprot:COSAG01_NODE_1968_length_8769_cov_5.768166_10_plen_152_part_00